MAIWELVILQLSSGPNQLGNLILNTKASEGNSISAKIMPLYIPLNISNSILYLSKGIKYLSFSIVL